jgi:hypothetical protein
MDKTTRNAIERATQQARRLLEDDFSSQLEGTFDVLRSGVVAPKGGVHLSARQHFQREKIVAAIEHKCAAGTSAVAAVADYVRDAAFTTLNRFVALKMLEGRQLVQVCITRGEQSGGYREFCGMAPGLALLPDAAGYRLYIESLFDEFSTEIKVLFDRRDAASELWPKRQTFEMLLTILNAPDLSGVWGEDETIGWVYQFFNSDDDREKMGRGKRPPAHSRELAVRNQFFTPRYVVQFLVDNTLGRVWLEMHGKTTRLVDLCDYLVNGGDEQFQPRLQRDPRDLRILDPACGSGHFLLYSFDLLLTIYEEAWAAEGPAPISDATGQSLRKDYLSLVDLRRAIPRLIVEHNLHGVDIDPRCAQIAALALWLRAQRAWRDFGIAASDRPRIQRTHIVVAEPMPGDAVLVDEFAARLDPPLLRDLFKKMVGESRLAGELGTLLRIEDRIAVELARAREQFAKQRQETGFLRGMEPVAKQGSLDLSGIDDDHFFHEAEARIVNALRIFSEAATGSVSVRRRLFAGDAAQGVALIDLVRTRFDVVLMNPPFGDCSLAAKKEFERSFPRTKNDIYAAFVERGIELLHPHGLLGAITSRTGFFQSSYQKWREEVLLKEAPPLAFADLGNGVLDGAMVEVAAYCLEKREATTMRTIFLRVLESDDKALALRKAIHEPTSARGRQRFEVNTTSFAAIPRSPFAYWVSESVLRLFEDLPAFEGDGRTVKQGLATADDFRFVRAWSEVPPQEVQRSWAPFAKGGEFSPFYADLKLVVKWTKGSRDGAELKAFAERTPGTTHWSRRIVSSNFYFRPGLTYPRRLHRLAVMPLPAGSIISVRGSGIFASQEELLPIAAVFSSSVFDFLVKCMLGRFGHPQFDNGTLCRAPFPEGFPSCAIGLGSLARRAIGLKRTMDTHSESSHAFTLPALLLVTGETIRARASAWGDHVDAALVELGMIQSEIDERCFDLYGISEADRKIITSGFGGDGEEQDATGKADETTDADGEDETGVEIGADAATLVAELVSWAAGVAFGRFDVRLATGVRPIPDEPDPFDPLPVCSPALLTDEHGLPSLGVPTGYTFGFPENGVLVDDPGHRLDFTAAVHAVFDEVFGADTDRWLLEIASLLSPKDRDLRAWMASKFFEYHLKRHCKSGRKAPIVWQLATPSARYSVWLYAHRLSRDTFFQIQNEIVAPKVGYEERQLASLIQGAGPNPSAKERKEIAEQEALVTELRSFLDDIKRVAPLWNLSLGDGVLLTMAPLWRLVHHHKSWQKELKSKWDELAAGNYDWAHIAMHLWPERVVPKCLIDRSLAIAHGLEDVFWTEGDDGKWKPRSTSTRPLDDLVRERTSSAVKAALEVLADGSTANGAKTRARRSSS